MPRHRAMWRVTHNSLFSPLSKQTTKEKDKTLNRFLGNKVVIIAKIAVKEEFPRVTRMSIK